MKPILPFILLFILLFAGNLRAQTQEKNTTRLFRIYEDNDFLNMRGKGTDDAYTNGTRFDLFYTKKHKPHFIVDRLMPKAGDTSVNVYGWGIMQVMFTPMDITKTAFQPNDYPYSGGLFATHTLYSYNPVKKYSFQTELLAGTMGPWAFAGEAQTFIHNIIHYKRPMGWDNQLGNYPLLNVNLTAEKQVAHAGNWMEVLAAGQVLAGTAMNGLAVYPMVRIGKMEPYFKGYLSQHSIERQSGQAGHRGRRVQAYIVIKPEANIVFTNALLQGGFLSNNNRRLNGKEISTRPSDGLRQIIYSANYGVVVSAGNFSMSFIQNSSSEWIKGTYSHEVGNISMYFSW